MMPECGCRRAYIANIFLLKSFFRMAYLTAVYRQARCILFPASIFLRYSFAPMASVIEED